MATTYQLTIYNGASISSRVLYNQAQAASVLAILRATGGTRQPSSLAGITYGMPGSITANLQVATTGLAAQYQPQYLYRRYHLTPGQSYVRARGRRNARRLASYAYRASY